VNQVALITGASRGIGRGIALNLAKLGCDLVVNYVENAKAAKKTAADCVELARTCRKKIRAEIFQADISKRTGRVKLVEFARAKFERLDLLVNNAGVCAGDAGGYFGSGRRKF
jgi:3-oxoacyl-[acyl-carrier protein] reductase